MVIKLPLKYGIMDLYQAQVTELPILYGKVLGTGMNLDHLSALKSQSFPGAMKMRLPRFLNLGIQAGM